MGCEILTAYVDRFPLQQKYFLISAPFGISLPTWAKMLLKNQSVLHWLRQFTFFEKIIVNFAYQTLNQTAQTYLPRYASIKGAYDALIALLTVQSKLTPITASAVWIYGEKDAFLKNVPRLLRENVMILPKAGHNCFPGNEEKILQILQRKNN